MERVTQATQALAVPGPGAESATDFWTLAQHQYRQEAFRSAAAKLKAQENHGGTSGGTRWKKEGMQGVNGGGRYGRPCMEKSKV